MKKIYEIKNGKMKAFLVPEDEVFLWEFEGEIRLEYDYLSFRYREIANVVIIHITTL